MLLELGLYCEHIKGEVCAILQLRRESRSSAKINLLVRSPLYFK